MSIFNGLQIQYYAGEKVYALLCSMNSDETRERVCNTSRMISDAMARVYDRLEHDFEINVCCNDSYPDFYSEVVLGYCKLADQQNVILIPDFNFLGRPSIGADNYDKTCLQMCEASKVKPEYNTLFWIGNEVSHESRRILLELSQKDKRIEAYGMRWGKQDEKGEYDGLAAGAASASKYVSLVDHTKYKYLIDLPGYGWSGRMKSLMFSGRPLFIPDHDYYEYWHEDLVPFENYIPVKGDLSDLSQRIDWAEEHPKECEEIAKNAQDYALHHLMYENAIEKLSEVLTQL